MPPFFPGPAYRIETQRLVIRCYQPTDAALLKTSIDESLEHLRPWMPWAHFEPQTIQQKLDLIRSFRGRFDLGQDYIYGIFNREETRLIGGTGLHTRLGAGVREIGYWVNQNFLKQGIATEVSAALTKVAFEVDEVRRVEIHCDPENVRSASVPRKLGYTHEATLRQHTLLNDGMYRDTMIWTILREEFANSPAAAVELQAFDAAGRRIL